MGAVRDKLRSATAEAHERMHRLQPFRMIIDGALDRQAYAQLLQGLLRFHDGIGAQAAAHRLTRYSGAAIKVGLLLEDLAALGSAAQPGEHPFVVPSAAHALGALYVAEGSMFGGKVLAGQLSYLLSGNEAPALFFQGTRLDAGRWRGLVQELERNAGDAAAVSAMVNGADIAFRWFEACLSLAPGPSAEQS